MTNEKGKEEIKLVKCTKCSKAFYLRTDKKGSLNLTCPYCSEDVRIKINGGIKYENDDSNPENEQPTSAGGGKN